MDKKLIWWGCWCGGGLCDRLLGLTTMYCISVELNRKFLIKWDDNNLVKINPEYNYGNEYFEQVILNNKESQDFFEDKNKVDSLENINSILMWSNQNLFYHFCKNREINYKEKLLNAFSLLFTKFLNKPYTPLPEICKYTGIHIRTNDKQFTNEKEKEKQIGYIRSVLEKCKNHIQNKFIFIASDCDITYDIAKDIFNDYKIIFNEGKIVHSAKTEDEKGINKVFQDLFSLRDCKEIYFGWHSNFSKVACLLDSKKNFYSYEYPNENNIRKCDILEIANYFSNPYWR